MLVMIAFGILLTFLTAVGSMGAAACGPTHPCNFPLLTAAQLLVPVAGVVALLVTIVSAIALISRGNSPAWAPCVGGALIVLAFIVAIILTNVSIA